MAGHTTEPSGGVPGLPVRALRAEVLEGKDAGNVAVATSDALQVGTAEGNDLLLTDPTVSRYHLELSPSVDGVRVLDHDSTNGTLFEGARLGSACVPAGSVLRIGKTAIRVDDGQRVTVELHGEDSLGEIHGRTPLMRRLMAQVARAGQADTPVLLVGESGTGKELIARALHDAGPRAREPFVTIDCGALSPALVASELFGHEKGAFTGADRRHEGAFERADGGTLFLDEVGELPPSLQPALLGALERRRFRRVGGRDEIASDVRIVAATHRDLRGMVNAGTFRLDLYYRIAVVVLRVPPLRERREDVPLLVEHFLREAGAEGELEELVGRETMDAFCAHAWPGNVRELRNVVEALLVMGETPELEGAPSGSEQSRARVLSLPYGDARAAVLADFERAYLPLLLERTDGNVSRAAREAKMDRTYLIKLLQRHGLK